MYRRAIDAFIRSYPLFLALAGVLSILDYFGTTTGYMVVELIIFANAAFFSHRIVLLKEQYRWNGALNGAAENGTKAPIWPFTWRYVAIMVLFFGVLGLFAWLLYSAAAPNDLSREGFQGILLLAMIPALLINGLVLSLIGTMLPAAAVQDDASLRASLRRGKRSFFKTLWRLFYGSFLFGLAVFALGIAAIWGLAQYGVAINAPGLVLSIIGNLVGLFSITLAATALSLAYEAAEDP